MKKTVVLAGLFFNFVALPAVATETHCTGEEQTIYSCSMGKKIVSVCASQGVTPKSGYMQYRFGLKGAPELVFPVSMEGGFRSVVRAQTLMFSGGGGAYLRFINGQYNYIVYTAIGKGWGTKDGVAVEKDGKLVTNLKCRDVPVSELGDDFFSRAGLTTDQVEFLPP